VYTNAARGELTSPAKKDIQFDMQPDASYGFKLHHVGIVTPVIEEQRAFYVDVLKYRQITAVIHDPIQTAFVQFFAIPGADHYIELVAPDSESSKLQRAARKGLPLNHLCYSCENTAEALSFLKESGCMMISDIVPAVAFDGRSIAWVMSPDGLLIELVERGPEGSL
jgi:methylmalonyl-CoA/ethylmalonyl-CoA epimerase